MTAEDYSVLGNSEIVDREKIHCDHLPTSFKCFRFEWNRKKKKFESNRLVTSIVCVGLYFLPVLDS